MNRSKIILKALLKTLIKTIEMIPVVGPPIAEFISSLLELKVWDKKEMEQLENPASITKPRLSRILLGGKMSFLPSLNGIRTLMST